MSKSFITRFLSKVLNSISAYDLMPPYDYVQNVVEWYLHSYIGEDDRASIRLFYIVGGYLGNEIPFLLKRYPNAKFKVFEPSLRYHERIARRFRNNDRVNVYRSAISDAVGQANFHETNLRGSGSLLKVGGLSRASYGAVEAETFLVDTVTLDSISGQDVIDCLWVDVQGAELLVLKGALDTLRRTRSIFIEVSIYEDLYDNGAKLDSITPLLREAGFSLLIQGLDRGNLTGNAFFCRPNNAATAQKP